MNPHRTFVLHHREDGIIEVRQVTHEVVACFAYDDLARQFQGLMTDMEAKGAITDTPQPVAPPPRKSAGQTGQIARIRGQR